MDTLLKDIRYGMRGLLKHPMFTVVAVLTLALGIGANTAMFTVVNAVLLRPLSFPESENLVLLQGINPSKGITESNMSVPDLSDWKVQNQVFEQISPFITGGVYLVSGDETERVRATGVTADFFPMMRTSAFRGRTFQAEDTQQGQEPVIILSHALWLGRFGSDPNIIGTKVVMNGKSTTVIGVMPPGFDYPQRAEVWAPLSLDPASEERFNRYVEAVARLKPGVTISQAQSDLDTINQRLAQTYTDSNTGWGVRITNLRESLVGDVRTALLILFGAVVFVLFIACANVGNLLLARSTYRHKEIALRMALGAGRLRIARQLLTESLLLAFISGVVGIALSVWLTRLLIAISPANSPRFNEIGLDARVFFFTFVVAILTGIFFGLAPVFQSSHTDLNETLKESGRLGTQGGGRNRIGSLLMVSEIAFSFVLLVGAGLLIKSFIHLKDVSPGFNSERVVVSRVAPPPGKYPPGESRSQIFDQIVEHARSIPGVQSAGAVLSLPLGGDTFNVGRDLLKEGDPNTPENGHDAMYLVVTPGYFSTLQIPLKTGREFSSTDAGTNAPKVIILNETMARQLWPNDNPIGKRVRLRSDEKFQREVVGIVGDTRQSMDKEPPSQMYVPFSQDANWGSLSLVVRTVGEPTAVSGVLRNEMKAVDKSIAVFNLRSMDDVVALSMAPRRIPMLLLTAFAGVAMVLAMLGIYGVTAYYVTQRTREIGIRIALGAQVRDVLRLILRRGLFLSLGGVLLGVAGAFALTRYLSSLLFGVKPFDGLTLIGVCLILVAVCLLACYLPARRATKVDPLEALRYE